MWTTDLEFAYEHGHVYLLDGARHWSDDDDAVDLRMPRWPGFFQPLRIEAWGAKPALDLDGWEHIAEFSLDLASGTLALASGGCGAIKVGIEAGAYRARWSARADDFRLQLWPGPAAVPRSELKRRNGNGSDLGDLPALLTDEGVQAVGAIPETRVIGDALRLDVHLAAWAKRTWERTIRCDGVVRWRATERAVRPRAAARRAPRPAPVRRRARRAFVPRPPAGAQPARARAARRARRGGGRARRVRGGDRGAARDRLRPAGERAGHAPAPLRQRRRGLRAEHEPDRHRPGPRRAYTARVGRLVRRRRALQRQLRARGAGGTRRSRASRRGRA